MFTSFQQWLKRPRRSALGAFATGAAVCAVLLIAQGPAQARFGGFGGGFGGGFHGAGFHGGGFAPHAMGLGMARPAMFPRMGFTPHAGGMPMRFAGHGPFMHRPFFHHRGHFAGPFAVGLASGLVLGASYGYGNADDDGYGYGVSNAGYAQQCYVIRRAVVGPWGGVVVRRELVCY